MQQCEAPKASIFSETEDGCSSCNHIEEEGTSNDASKQRSDNDSNKTIKSNESAEGMEKNKCNVEQCSATGDENVQQSNECSCTDGTKQDDNNVGEQTQADPEKQTDAIPNAVKSEEKKWEDMTEAEQDESVKKYCIQKVCETYKRIVDAEILGSFSTHEGEFNGPRLKERVKGAADEYLDEVLRHALKDVKDDSIHDELFDLKDTIEVDFDEQFAKYFLHFHETNQKEIVPWSLNQGEILMQGYQKNCETFFGKAYELLAKHNITLDLGPIVLSLVKN